MHNQNRHYHFIGIGGIGMSGLAELLLHWGYRVTGTDLQMSDNTARLVQLGADVKSGHDRNYLPPCDVVVYSAAVKPDNPELQEARARNLKTIRRAELLGEIFALKKQRIAVSGTHGKTTTTAMTGAVLTAAGCDPSIITGGVLKTKDSPLQVGQGDYIVAEADEFDRSFLQLRPTHTIITTIEAEHLDCYASLDDIKQTFIQFAEYVPRDGKIILCGDESEVRSILPSLTKPCLVYGLAADNTLTATNLCLDELQSEFRVSYAGKSVGQVRLQVPGRHNIKNALAAIGLGLTYDLPFRAIADGLSAFRGVKRRFEVLLQTDELMLVDDYAHHPTEIAATLQAARQGWKQRRLIAVFQPHLFTRTRDFYPDFARVLQGADIVLLLDVYPARELPLTGISSQLIFDEMRKANFGQVYFVHDRQTAVRQFFSLHQPGDMLVTLGAGDVNKMHQEIIANRHNLEDK